MSSEKLDVTWCMMSQHRFALANGESMQDGLSCTICTQMMVDPFQGSVCGCQYCHKCIVGFLQAGDLCCPGGRSECSEEQLVIGSNLFRNMRTSRQILKSTVCCPNDGCQVTTEISQMEEHLRLCREISIVCPYVFIGCSVERSDHESILTHLSANQLPHSQILIELIQNLKNEVDGLRNETEKCKSEIVLLREDLEVNNVRGEEHKRQMEEQQKQMDEQKRQIEDQKMQMEEKQKQMEEQKKSLDNQRREMGSMKQQMQSKDKKIMALDKELKLFSKKLDSDKNIAKETMKEEIDGGGIVEENIVKVVDDLKKDVTALREERTNLDKANERKWIYWIKWKSLCPHIGVDFVWKIEKCSQICATNYSESFHSNNYKLRLWMYNYGNDYIGLWCVVMVGEFDGMVRWPLRHAVVLSIINQNTMEAFKSEVYTYGTYSNNAEAFMRPKDDLNHYIGSPSFLKYSFIKCKASIIVDDSIVVSCVLKDS